ncbi:MAG: hypothetical protein P1U68_17155 [Verrucomicrobiales bacterium]|nr:hypothetical protein [Verrucomicrobiales bacterium]
MKRIGGDLRRGISAFFCRILLLLLAAVIGGLPSLVVQGYAWCSMAAGAQDRPVIQVILDDPPCEFCDLARAIQPDPDQEGDLPHQEKGIVLLALLSSPSEDWTIRGIPYFEPFCLQGDSSLRDLWQGLPLVPPPQFSPACLS